MAPIFLWLFFTFCEPIDKENAVSLTSWTFIQVESGSGYSIFFLTAKSYSQKDDQAKFSQAKDSLAK